MFEVEPIDGKPLQTNLIIDLQRLAERTLAKTKSAECPGGDPALDRRSGRGREQCRHQGPVAGDRRSEPPGSTFKVVSALALLRAGLDPGSRVDCPDTVTVDGKKFKNYDDYPSGARPAPSPWRPRWPSRATPPSSASVSR